MQLRTLAVLVLALAPATRATAKVEGTTHVTLFREPSSSNKGVQVIHPQSDVSADLGSVASVTAGYDVEYHEFDGGHTVTADLLAQATTFAST